MSIQFNITINDPLATPHAAVSAKLQAALAEPWVHLIMERDEDCPFEVFAQTLETTFPGISLVHQDMAPRYYRVRKGDRSFGARWGGKPFNQVREEPRILIPPCDHLFRVNRQGEIYAYEVPK